MKPYSKLSLTTAVRRAMPKPAFELTEAQLEKLRTYSEVILGILAVAGILTVTVLAPNALQALKIFEKRKGRRKLRHKEKERKVINTFYYLKRKGDIEIRRKGESLEVKLTKKGQRVIKKLEFASLAIPRAKMWDGKFWQVAADIPVEYRLGADAFRDKIKQMGFYPLQRTLWFYPYDPRLEIEFVARTYGIASFVTVMKIAELDSADEVALKKYFKKQGLI